MLNNCGSSVERVSFFAFVRFHFLLFTFYFLLFLLFGVAAQISAQEPAFNELAPPPLKTLVKAEKEQLEKQTDLKQRTKLALELMEARLKKAEERDKQNQFLEMYAELGKFHALLDYTYGFLYRKDDGSSKVLNNFKRFETGIRAHVPRLELLRRNLPIRYEHYVRTLIKSIKDTRSKAVEALFDDSVVPQATNKP